MKTGTKKTNRWKPLLMLLLALGLLLAVIWWYMLKMPGESSTGSLVGVGINVPAGNRSLRDDAEDETGIQAKSTEQMLREHVNYLSVDLGERNLGQYKNLEKAAQYIKVNLAGTGFDIRREIFEVRGLECQNIEAELTGSSNPNEIVIICAHYDSFVGTPGANDNASGTAALLVLASQFQNKKPARTVRFVAFTNEEPPYFQSDEMGSVVYAKGCRHRDENLVAVISLETMGYFIDEPDSQHYPAALSAFYPSTGNFLGFVGNLASRPLLHQTIGCFRKQCNFPSEGAVLPGAIPGVGWSDHWSFWQEGYQGIMITDTAPFRYPHYHLESDLPEHVCFDKLATIVDGLETVIDELSNSSTVIDK